MIQILINLEQVENGEQINATANAHISPVVALGLLEAAKQVVLSGNLQVVVPENKEVTD
jgi:hypothetical protein